MTTANRFREYDFAKKMQIEEKCLKKNKQYYTLVGDQGQQKLRTYQLNLLFLNRLAIISKKQ